MIRIHKPEIAPKKLTIAGKKKCREHCLSYSKDPSAYETGVKKFKFSQAIYAQETVKRSLRQAQSDKCCFCEAKIGNDGDVEHFRPKQAYQQSTGEALQRPGYYWLAYEWDNLYLACTGCNQRHKQNLFPLLNQAQRAKNHEESIKNEQPLFIDCGQEDPEKFIGFRGEFAYAIDSDRRGRVTIDSLGLNDTDRTLPERRLGHLANLKVFFGLLDIALSLPENIELQELAKEAKAQLDFAIVDSAQFASATRFAIRSGFQDVSAILENNTSSI